MDDNVVMNRCVKRACMLVPCCAFPEKRKNTQEGSACRQTLMHNWYWARASVGPYTVIASYITATAAYGYETQIVYLLARDGKIIADDDAKVYFEADRVVLDGKTGKPVADVTRYTYRDSDTRYDISFEREATILQSVFTDRMPLLKRVVARLVGFDGAYHRFTGKVAIEKFERGLRVARFDDRAMYFGKARRCVAPQANFATAAYGAPIFSSGVGSATWAASTTSHPPPRVR
jgi:hypothetical protein